MENARSIYAELTGEERENIKMDHVIGVFRKAGTSRGISEPVLGTDFEMELKFFTGEMNTVNEITGEMEKGIKTVPVVPEIAYVNPETSEEENRVNKARINNLLFAASEKNTGKLLKNTVMDFYGMTVVTNRYRVLGAAAIIGQDVRRELIQRFHTNRLVVFPSSIHEMIVMPETMYIPGMEKMIKEINANEVLPEDVLSDNGYFYDAVEGTFEMIYDE